MAISCKAHRDIRRGFLFVLGFDELDVVECEDVLARGSCGVVVVRLCWQPPLWLLIVALRVERSPPVVELVPENVERVEDRRRSCRLLRKEDTMDMPLLDPVLLCCEDGMLLLLLCLCDLFAVGREVIIKERS